jgi:fucose 4-O-acetylase-like acetyltransferase
MPLERTAPAVVLRPARVVWLDVAKGVGILLVVYGHVSSGLIDAGVLNRDSAAAAACDLVYTFHMPLFFFLSGIWLKRAAAKRYSNFLGERLRTIAYPYFVWSTLQFVANLAMARYTNGAPAGIAQLVTILYRPQAQFWFLYVLFILVVGVTPVLKLPFGAMMAVIVSVAAYATYPFAAANNAPTGSQILHFAVYVALGAALGPALTRVRSDRIVRAACLALALASLAVLVRWFWRAGDVGPLRLAVASLLGMLGVIAAGVAIGESPLARVLAFLGRRSLEIYVAHVLAAAGMRIMLVQLYEISDPMTHLVLDTAAGVALPLALWWATEFLRPNFFFTLRAEPGTPGAASSSPEPPPTSAGQTRAA